MVWVCPICSSNNDASVDVCTVCGYKQATKKINTLTKKRVSDLGLTGNVIIPEEFNVVGEMAFKGRSDITSVVFHPEVRKISKEAFCGCKNLTDIEVQGKINSVGARAFAECPKLPKEKHIKAKYVADDAYSLASIVNSSTRSSSSTSAPSNRGSTRPTTIVDRNYKISGISERYFDVDKSESSRESIRPKIPAWWIILVSVLSITITVLLNNLFANEPYSLLLICFGIPLFFISGLIFYKWRIDSDFYEFVSKTKIQIAAIALIAVYLLAVFIPGKLMWLSTYISGGLLLGEIITLISKLVKRDARYNIWLISFMLVNAALLYTIIVIWKG